MFNSLRRKSRSEKIVFMMVSCLFLVVALSYLYILVWTFIAGTRTHTEIVMEPFGLPAKWNFAHYLEVWDRLEVNGNGFVQMLLNSIWFSVIGAFLTQLCSATFAYCVSKYTFPGSEWIYTAFVIILTMPLYGSGGAQYALYHKWGLVDNYLQILTAYSALNIYTMYYMAYFKNTSNAYYEAARMDGAQDFQIYFRIMLPQAKPIFCSLFLTQWVGVWNSYESALVYLPNTPTLPVGIYQFNQEMIYQARLDILFAACFITVMPALILFIAFNKTITTSVTIGGLKG